MRAFNVFAVAFLVLASISIVHGDELDALFQSPPPAAHPLTWWHWMNGNVSREGITADLESMKRVGLAGCQLFNVDGGIPPGPVKIMSPQWLDLVKHAVNEAQRLGLEFGMHNCPGWSSSGGPWNTPEHGMQIVFSTEQQLAGPTHFDTNLPLPATPLGHYHDIAVLAFPTPASDQPIMAEASPRLTASHPTSDLANLIDDNPDTTTALPRPTPDHPEFITIEFPKPFAARQLTVIPGKEMHTVAGDLLASDDGQSFHKVCPFSIAAPEWVKLVNLPFTFPRISSRYYRIQFNNASGATSQLIIAKVSLSGQRSISNLVGKVFFDRRGDYSPDKEPAAPSDVIQPSEIVDLSSQLSPEGHLTWDVPPGHWTLLRIGYAPNSMVNHPTPVGGEGLECDKLSTEAVDAHWAGMLQPVIDMLGPLAGRTFTNVVVDSYEVGSQNWTPKFREEFHRLRGYDLLSYLPIVSGHIVSNPEVSDRFLWDFRRTIADLFTQNYAGHIAELAHKNGLTLGLEPYGDTEPADDLQYGGPADVPMTEFWYTKGFDHCTTLAVSAAHTHGRRLVGSESFTSGELGGNRWDTDPFALKPLGDVIFAAGANRFSLHCYTHQPWLHEAPGMTMGACGTHFGRTNTWWNLSTDWITYLSRCQAMLQQGLPVVDVLYYAGEDVPASAYGDGLKNPGVPDGYAYDGCDRDVLLDRLTVKDGRLVLPDGMRYRLLVLPRKPTMRPEILRKIKALVDAGATVVGPIPTAAPGLTDYPRCDQEIAELAQQARVADISPADALAALHLPPDFEFAGPKARLVYNHRATTATDIYFLSNQRPTAQEVSCTFRITGKLPELFHPDTGRVEPAPIFTDAAGRTTLPIRFDPAGSAFVVFREPAPADHLTAAPPMSPMPSGRLVIDKADFCNFEDASRGSVDVTSQVSALVKDNLLALRVTNALAGGSDHGIPGIKGLRIQYHYNGKPSSAGAMQDRVLEIPSADDLDFTPPAFDYTSTPEGHPAIRFWQDGKIELSSTSGKPLTMTVNKVAAPVELTGSWEVHFPPNLGAPEKTVLDRLTNWADSPDPGIKYFSGTATYSKTIDVSADELGDGKAIYLDLGHVKNIAEVRLNAVELGVLWKPPFRVDCSAAVKPGANLLEIRITNLWPNRLIGDEHLPSDRQWRGQHLATFPQWALQDKPSPTGRITFATWHHWSKDDTLLPSGLLGPVYLRQARLQSLSSFNGN